MISGFELRQALEQGAPEELAFICRNTPVHSVQFHEFGLHLPLVILRCDLLHPVVGGNKLFKLWGHFAEGGAAVKHNAIASFGGAHSNHLHALAWLCREFSLPLKAFIRGEKTDSPSATLVDLERFGAECVFLSRSEYRHLTQVSFPDTLDDCFGPHHWIPEGGGGIPGARGASALGHIIRRKITEGGLPGITHVLLACGTGSTAAGVIKGMAGVSNPPVVWAISVLKGEDRLTGAIDNQLAILGPEVDSCPEWRVISGYHCGGYARFPPVLQDFLTRFEALNSVMLDPVYTAKMMWAVHDLQESGQLPKDARVLAIHTGGLQGRRGYGLLSAQDNMFDEFFS